MKAITLTHPWASLVALGVKQVETRSWQTPYRGPLAIHAAKSFPPDAQALCYEDPFKIALLNGYGHGPVDFGCMGPDALPTGCVLAICDLVDIFPTESVSRNTHTGRAGNLPLRTETRLYISERERAFGDYAPGRFAWVLKNVRALPEPIPAKGMLGLWEWSQP